jgi:hypothetical protein
MIARDRAGRDMEVLGICGPGWQSNRPYDTLLGVRVMKWRFIPARHDPLAGARGSVDAAVDAGSGVRGEE